MNAGKQIYKYRVETYSKDVHQLVNTKKLENLTEQIESENEDNKPESKEEPKKLNVFENVQIKSTLDLDTNLICQKIEGRFFNPIFQKLRQNM